VIRLISRIQQNALLHTKENYRFAPISASRPWLMFSETNSRPRVLFGSVEKATSAGVGNLAWCRRRRAQHGNLQVNRSRLSSRLAKFVNIRRRLFTLSRRVDFAAGSSRPLRIYEADQLVCALQSKPRSKRMLNGISNLAPPRGEDWQKRFATRTGEDDLLVKTIACRPFRRRAVAHLWHSRWQAPNRGC
jgi:hypothetical protein